VGRGDYTPNHFRECGRLLKDNVLPDVGIIALSRLDNQGFCSFNLVNAYTREIVEAVRKKAV
jgi:acyl-CoA hydrolase